MPLTCSQIITLALQDARKKGFTVQAGQLFQMILDDLCYKYDLQVNLGSQIVALTGLPVPATRVGVTPGCGPYMLPINYLRMAQDEVVYSVGGAPFKMINTDLSDIDLASLLPTNSNYPEIFATDISTVISLGSPSMWVWPPPIFLINVNIRYFKLQPAITSPEISATIPWFNDAMYLKSRLTGELLKPGAAAKPFLEEAQLLLDQYLKLEDDSEGRAIIMKKDERQFPRGLTSKLPRTKGFDF